MFLEKFKFNKKEEVSVGLDIGSSSIKAVALELKDKEYFLKNFNLTEFFEGADDLSSTVKNILGSIGINAEKINISLSGQSVTIRYAWLPLMTGKELKSCLKFETAKLIPFSIEEVNVDSYILKQDAPNNRMLVLIVAAKKEAVSERIKLLQDFGFKVGVVDIDSLALINAFNFNHQPREEEGSLPKVFALLNVGASVSNLNIVEAGVPVFSRDIYIAGNNFSKKIADFFEISFRDAENLKVNPDKDKLDKIITSAESVLSSLITEVRMSFDYYESQGASSVEKIFLSGGGSLFYNLKDNLNNALGIEIDYWNPMQRITFLSDSDTQGIEPRAVQFAVALGLAMR